MFRTTDSIRWKDIFPKFVDSLESIHKAQSRLAIRCSYSFGEPTIHKAIERVIEEFSSLDGKDGERSTRNIIISYLTDSSTSRRFANLTSSSFPCRYLHVGTNGIGFDCILLEIESKFEDVSIGQKVGLVLSAFFYNTTGQPSSSEKDNHLLFKSVLQRKARLSTISKETFCL